MGEGGGGGTFTPSTPHTLYPHPVLFSSSGSVWEFALELLIHREESLPLLFHSYSHHILEFVAETRIFVEMKIENQKIFSVEKKISTSIVFFCESYDVGSVNANSRHKTGIHREF